MSVAVMFHGTYLPGKRVANLDLFLLNALLKLMKKIVFEVSLEDLMVAQYMVTETGWELRIWYERSEFEIRAWYKTRV